MADATYSPKFYREQGGNRAVVASGGSLDVESGGEIDIESGGSLKIGGVAVTATAAEINAIAGGGLSSAELGVLDSVTPGTIAASKAVVVDANKDAAAFRNVSATNVDAGASGTAGSVDVFPTTASKGKLSITAADSAGDTTTTIVNANQAGARTYTIPDAGASADFLMSAGGQSISGGTTINAGGAAAALALRFGASTTEGLEIKVIDEVVATGAINNDLTEDVPSGAVILSVQANVETALTGGGTTANFGIGTAGDPDKYSPTVGALTQDAKTDNIPDWAVLSGAEDIQVNGVTGAGAAGDTALTVGTVRVRIVYLVCNSLDNA